MTIALILGPLYLVLGLSILLYAKVWQNAMKKWESDHLSLFTMEVLSMVMGLIVVNMHNVWEWNVWILVTLTGWIMLVKGVSYMLLPGTVIKWALKLKQNLVMLYLGGVVAVGIGGVLGYYAYLA